MSFCKICFNNLLPIYFINKKPNKIFLGSGKYFLGPGKYFLGPGKYFLGPGKIFLIFAPISNFWI